MTKLSFGCTLENMEKCDRVNTKVAIALARRIARGETVTATPAEREAAEAMVECSREFRRLLRGGK